MRGPRKVIPGYPHHVILRANNRRRLFSYKREYRLFIWHVGRAVARFACELNAMVLVTNHVHMVLTPTLQAALAGFVKAVAQRYAQARNRQRGGSGKLFEERFWSKPIEDERELALVLSYVELNPVRAHLATRPDAYAWSTCRLHVGRTDASEIPRQIWTPTPWYLQLGDTAAERVKRYEEWLGMCQERAEAEDAQKRRDPATEQYTRRLERPDRTSAKEPLGAYDPSGRSFAVAAVRAVET